jgi:hypothetical protein
VVRSKVALLDQRVGLELSLDDYVLSQDPGSQAHTVRTAFCPGPPAPMGIPICTMRSCVDVPTPHDHGKRAAQNGPMSWPVLLSLSLVKQSHCAQPRPSAHLGLLVAGLAALVAEVSYASDFFLSCNTHNAHINTQTYMHIHMISVSGRS